MRRSGRFFRECPESLHRAPRTHRRGCGQRDGVMERDQRMDTRSRFPDTVQVFEVTRAIGPRLSPGGER
jgi:hypothetical protein